MDTLLVITHAPDQAVAQSLAEALVTRRLAACVNMLAPVRSVYHWQGALETAQEVPLLIKTTSAQYASVQQAIVELHPYELPEVIAVPIVRGLPAYLDWVAAETGGGSASGITGRA
jgi:periplasmic divalent cation tolerance protein